MEEKVSPFPSWERRFRSWERFSVMGKKDSLMGKKVFAHGKEFCAHWRLLIPQTCFVDVADFFADGCCAETSCNSRNSTQKSKAIAVPRWLKLTMQRTLFRGRLEWQNRAQPQDL